MTQALETLLRERDLELSRLRDELEATNRGVVALYAELEQKADSLRRATELKSRFLANMSHEFRTPLNSIQSLARILLDGLEGPLSDDQQHAVALIRTSAVGLSDMVNDLLDLAKIEAGKVSVRPEPFTVAHLFGSLRAMLRPLTRGAVPLVFDEVPPGLPELTGDESRTAQILRNFCSNALKFTERGEVRVSARQDGERVVLSVSDTGIGIAAADLERVFEEFAQVDNPIQRKVRGTGLGLPLSRKLAALLGGSIEVRSTPGQGSTFSLALPLRYEAPSLAANDDRQAVLAVHDDGALLASWESDLEGTRYRLVPALTFDEARAAVPRERPVAIAIGAFLGGQPTRPLIAELKKVHGLPLLGLAGEEHEERLLALGADVITRPPRGRHELLEQLARLLSPPGSAHG